MPLAMDSLVSTFHDAAISPEAWPEALTALTEAAGVAGAALIISNKRTGNVDEAYFCGLSAGFKSEYIWHYAALDPYSPLLDGTGKNSPSVFPTRYYAKASGTTILYWRAAFAIFSEPGSSIRRPTALSSAFTSRSVADFLTGSIRLSIS
jgi:hypothetical protein